MSKQSPFAREDVMEAYLDSLLKEQVEPDEASVRASRLLEQAAQQIVDESPSPVEDNTLREQTAEQDVLHEPSNKDIDLTKQDDAKFIEDINQQVASDDAGTVADNVVSNTKLALKDKLDERFQALFFEVAGLTLAVPLITLGGIHELGKIGPLFGKPDWFMGVMLHRDEKLSVVDSAKWVMPEKYDETLAQSLNYRYLIMLGESQWGLASEKLVNTVTLSKADVKWRESVGKRPWLAGMVKERMCALIDVSELIIMLNKGLGSNDQTP
jgi:purine-binding chemotaxis protein CheW